MAQMQGRPMSTLIIIDDVAFDVTDCVGDIIVEEPHGAGGKEIPNELEKRLHGEIIVTVTDYRVEQVD